MKNKKIYLLLSSRTIIFIILFTITKMITQKDFNDMSNIWTIVINVCNVTTIAVLIYICKKKNISFYKLFNYNEKRMTIKELLMWTIIIFLVGIIGMYIVGFVMYNSFPYTPTVIMKPIPRILAILNVIVLPILTTIAEEGLYLGFGMNQIDGKCKSIVIPTFFYAIQHSFLPMILDYKYIFYRFFSFVPVILVMCVYYYKEKKIAPIMLGHFIINFVTVIGILNISV